MLLHGREFNDGEYKFELISIEEIGYIVKSENVLTDKELKQYFTKDDESAMAVFEAMIDCYEREGSQSLAKFKYKDRLSSIYSDNIEANNE